MPPSPSPDSQHDTLAVCRVLLYFRWDTFLLVHFPKLELQKQINSTQQLRLIAANLYYHTHISL